MVFEEGGYGRLLLGLFGLFCPYSLSPRFLCSGGVLLSVNDFFVLFLLTLLKLVVIGIIINDRSEECSSSQLLLLIILIIIPILLILVLVLRILRAQADIVLFFIILVHNLLLQDWGTSGRGHTSHVCDFFKF